MISTCSLPIISVKRRSNTIVGQVSPGTDSTALEQARKALDLALHVLLAALDDQLVGITAGDDMLRLVARRAEHAHRVIVRQRHIADRFVGHRADVADHVLRHHRRGLRVDHHDAVVADHHAGVRVAFGRVGVGVIRQPVETDFLFLEIGLRGELLFHGIPRRRAARGGENESMVGFRRAAQAGRAPSDRTKPTCARCATPDSALRRRRLRRSRPAR